MADIEGRLLSRLLTERQWRPILEGRVDEDWFLDEEHRAVFAFIARHYSKYGEVPTKELLDAQHPGYRVRTVEDSLPALVGQMQDRRNYGLTVEALQDAGELVDQNPDNWPKALDLVQRMATTIQQESSSLQDVDLTKTWEDRLQRYEDRARNGGKLLGIPTGFSTIDLATGGAQKQQLITIIATPKIGKSTLAMRWALNAWEWGARVLFISFEMSNLEQEARHDSMLANISHTEYQRGSLDRHGLAKLRRALEGTEGEHPFILSADINAVTTVSGVSAKIEEHQPDIVFVDGLYLMRDELGEDEGSPQALTNITRNLKRVCQRRDVPIVGSTQALLSKVSKKKGVDANSIGYSSSFAQDSDVILGLQGHEHDEDMRELRVVMSRNCGRVSTGLIWDWTDSSFYEPTEEDAA